MKAKEDKISSTTESRDLVVFSILRESVQQNGEHLDTPRFADQGGNARN